MGTAIARRKKKGCVLMDKLYIDTSSKAVTVELPQHGTVTVIVQDGKVIRTETTTSQKIR